ncbi:phage tail protein [Algimonas porphyrae]|uniref:Phage tail fibre protein N-terminal domain-containing protein n=1 Tax=Algimonas porphyrae TaxID=1128113 RepID=A0ABQ5UYZ1_9PROT|nr:phage tail protein [Algimonas porphyrae]GLQ20509.1 hypothetical protein GCM10007854_14640 [Algimonas porphyrae]
MSTYQAKLTDAGRAAVTNAFLTGDMVSLTQFAVGDGGGPVTGVETALRSERWRGAVQRLAPLGVDGDRFTVEVTVPSDVGGFTIREIGLLTADGVLVAIANVPDTDKVVAEEGAVTETLVGFDFAVEHPGVVELKIDPTTTIASRAFVEDRVRDAELIGHLALTAAMTNRMKLERKRFQ